MNCYSYIAEKLDNRRFAKHEKKKNWMIIILLIEQLRRNTHRIIAQVISINETVLY